MTAWHRAGRRPARFASALVLAGVLAVSGCARPAPAPPPAPGPVTASPAPAAETMTLSPVGFDALPGWRHDTLAPALAAFLAGCRAMGTGKSLGGSGAAAALGGNAADWQAACAAGRQVPPGDEPGARAFFERAFQPYAITSASGGANGSDQGLFTGYYEPEIAGSLTPAAGYATPLYAEPRDIVQADLGAFAPDLKGRHVAGRVENGRFVPYFDRAAIDAGALAGRRLEILWLADKIDAFFLEIQGSGRVRLPDGQVIRVSFAGQNGRGYVPIGRVIAERDHIPPSQISLQSIRAWLAAHPDQAQAVMEQNPSYVFFRELPGTGPQEGPPGSLGAGLTPGRSVAVDRGFIPLGAPLWIDTTDPLDGAPLQRLMVAQDTGGAIKGPVRADIFWGWGPDAEARAGKARQQGRDFLLLPRGGGAVAMLGP
jgi:membrane-bound lytic murein transglycosylase A